MPLGQDETIALGPVRMLRIVAHDVIVERHQQIGCSQASADVPGVCPVDHFNDAAPDLGRLTLQDRPAVSVSNKLIGGFRHSA